MTATPEERQLVLQILSHTMAMMSNLFIDNGPSKRGVDPAPCCDACSNLSTGQYGIPFFNAATQEWDCTVIQANKVLGGGLNGNPIWANTSPT